MLEDIDNVGEILARSALDIALSLVERCKVVGNA